MEILEEKPATWSDVKKVLEAKAKEKELGYEQKNALEHLRKFHKLTAKAEKELREAFAGIEKLKEKQISLLLTHLPTDMDQLRLVLTYEHATVTEDDKKAIIKAIKSVVG